MLEKFLACLTAQGWKLERNLPPDGDLPGEVRSRYPDPPAQWLEMIARVKSLVRGDDEVWFLCTPDFAPHGADGWRWNEWELLSLEAAEGDEPWQARIRAFWDRHLPILLSVSGGRYAYYAIDLEDGSVAHGAEPEFEECRAAAPSFPEFLERVIRGELSL